MAHDIAAARDRYAPDADWDALDLSLHIQAVIQGAFILAKATDDVAVAQRSIDHLKRYIEMLFGVGTGRTETPIGEA
ncbi:MAG: hypothetical protein KKB02_15825 [Alphaproteobacteria bacterium]|nr:hypothetical protein [Alphaproteobacteria bacterium]